MVGIVMALVMIFAFLPMVSGQAYAEDKDDISGVVLTEDGLLSWETFYGAGSYEVSLSGPVGYGGIYSESDMPIDIYQLCMRYHFPSGEYPVTLVALRNADWPYGEEISNKWKGTYSFTRPAGNVYTITFDANGGSGTIDAQTVEEDTYFRLPPCTFTPPEGCTFKEWMVNGEKYGEYYSFICNADTTVYAVWKYPAEEIKNVKISPTGYLSWDPYEDAGIYELTVYNWGIMVNKDNNPFDLYQFCKDKDFTSDREYDVTFVAEENPDWPYGEEISKKWYSKYLYQEFPCLVTCDSESYYVKEDRTLLINSWKKIGSDWYYFNADGTMANNAWKKDSKGWCYLGADGRMVTNDWAQDSKGMCWIGPDGYMVEKTQWIQCADGWYYIEKGYRVENKWKKDSKGWCYLGLDGRMVTNGWAKDSKGWCWIGPAGYMVEKTQWIRIGSDWYHITKGYRDENKWMKDSKGWCYLAEDGKMATNGWAKDSKGWCWIGSAGYMVEETKWIEVDGDWYHITKGYRDQKKWMKDSIGWCYLGDDGKMLKNEWLEYNGHKFYLKDSGYMACDEVVTIDGVGYLFDENGYLVGAGG